MTASYQTSSNTAQPNRALVLFKGRIDQDIEASVISGVVDEPQRQLPLRDTELSAFLVKVSEFSVAGMVALNGISVAALQMWISRKQALGDKSKLVCEYPDLQIFLLLAAIAISVLTAWVSSMAKAVEHNQSCLGRISGFVIALFFWPVFLGGFMVHCMTGAAIWKIVPVAMIVIVIMLAIWATTFNHPKILRRFFFCWCCFGRDPAAARAIEDERIARATADSVSSAKAAYVAQLTLEEKATVAKDRASKAHQAHAEAEQEAAAAKNRAEKATSDLQQIAQQVNDEAAAGSGKHEAEHAAALTRAKEADNAYKAAQRAADDAKERALETAADADNKKKEAEGAAAVARRERERAVHAKAFLGL